MWSYEKLECDDEVQICLSEDGVLVFKVQCEVFVLILVGWVSVLSDDQLILGAKFGR